MNIQYKAITFALLFTPAIAMASEDHVAGDWLHDVYSGAFMEQSRANSDVAMDINKTIEQEPTAAGLSDDIHILPVNVD